MLFRIQQFYKCSKLHGETGGDAPMNYLARDAPNRKHIAKSQAWFQSANGLKIQTKAHAAQHAVLPLAQSV